jgi:glycosyltransferase involved in cell wall biosynthesis
MRILFLNQAYRPDVVSTAQHAGNIAEALAAAGHDVTVVAARRGYDEPTRRFPARETRSGVRVIRVRCSGLGKSARWRRVVDFGSFLISCAARVLALPRQDVVVAMTTPPQISLLAALFVRLNGGRLVSWIMDLNPDEAIAARWIAPDSWTARVMDRMLRFSLATSDAIIVLDRFMKERITWRGVEESKISVIPPWTHDEALAYDDGARLRFRAAHGLEGKFVVMYSGNHSPCHPLDTVLEAARRLSVRPEIAFCFIGGGRQYPGVCAFVREHKLNNVVCLPYQPLEDLSGSLSAADLHLIVMGDAFAGIVHPCKVYNILALGIPYLYIGPDPSHITDIIAATSPKTFALRAQHGDVERVISHILRSAEAPCRTVAAHRLVAIRYASSVLVPRMAALIESLAPQRQHVQVVVSPN